MLGWALGGVILSVIGLVGAAFVKNHGRAAGLMMLISGLLGLFVALGFWIGALLLLVAGIISLIKRERPMPDAPPVIKTTFPFIAPLGTRQCETKLLENSARLGAAQVLKESARFGTPFANHRSFLLDWFV